MGKRKIYLRPPSPDYAPNKAIRLGHIWLDPRDPGSLIGPPLPFPDSLDVNFTWKTDYATSTGHESTTMVGVWTEFLQFLGIVANASVEWGSSKDHDFSCPLMETHSIEPSPQYIRASLEASEYPGIRKGERLYMITGVKIARGGTEAIRREARRALEAQVGADATAATGFPISFGPKFGMSRSEYAGESFGNSADFVFAYRLREIKYDKNEIRTRPYEYSTGPGRAGLTPEVGIAVGIGSRFDMERESEPVVAMLDDDMEMSLVDHGSMLGLRKKNCVYFREGGGDEDEDEDVDVDECAFVF